MNMIRPPVEELVPVLGFLAADFMSSGTVAFRVLNEPIVSMSITVLKAFAERASIGEMKFPAAPALQAPKSATYLTFEVCWEIKTPT